MLDSEYIDYIKVGVLERNLTAHAVYKELERMLGASAPSYMTVKYWSNNFKAARDGYDDEESFHDSKKIDKKFRDFMRLGVLEQKPSNVILKELQEMYGAEAPARSTVYNWTARIRAAFESNSIDFETERPRTRTKVASTNVQVNEDPTSNIADTQTTSINSTDNMYPEYSGDEQPPAKRSCPTGASTSAGLSENESVSASETRAETISNVSSDNHDMPYVKTETLDEGKTPASVSLLSAATSVIDDDDSTVSPNLSSQPSPTAWIDNTTSTTQIVPPPLPSPPRPLKTNNIEHRSMKISLNNGFDRGLEPDRILADINIDGQRLFLMKWKRSTIKDLGKRVFYFGI